MSGCNVVLKGNISRHMSNVLSHAVASRSVLQYVSALFVVARGMASKWPNPSASKNTDDITFPAEWQNWKFFVLAIGKVTCFHRIPACFPLRGDRVHPCPMANHSRTKNSFPSPINRRRWERAPSKPWLFSPFIRNLGARRTYTLRLSRSSRTCRVQTQWQQPTLRINLELRFVGFPKSVNPLVPVHNRPRCGGDRWDYHHGRPPLTPSPYTSTKWRKFRRRKDVRPQNSSHTTNFSTDHVSISLSLHINL